VHGNNQERVFSESEVRELIGRISTLANEYWMNGGLDFGAPDMLSVDEIEAECKQFGIILDPK
jgi:hypothetical protein